MQLNHAKFIGGSRVDLLAPTEASILRRRIEALGDLDNVALRTAWQNAWRSAAPKGARKRFLMLGIAWKWQAEVFGGFGRELARRLSALEAQDRVSGRVDERGKPKAIAFARPFTWHKDSAGLAGRAARSPCDRTRLSLAGQDIWVAVWRRKSHDRS
jgi:hypothetical protein